jgi:hypothetical protein
MKYVAKTAITKQVKSVGIGCVVRFGNERSFSNPVKGRFG